MISNACIEAACEEIRAVGLEPAIRPTGKHAAVTWRVGDVERVFHAPLTPSDHRSHMNARSEVRRMLRSDGLLASEEPANVGDRPRLFLQGGAFHCNSRDVAAHFGKQHKNVLRDIDRMLVDLGAEFGRLNFEPTSQADAQGRQQRCFNLSRDGFVLLAMGFTGADAMAWKVKYLEAFNTMEAELRRSVPALPEDTQARLEKLEGDLAALVDLCLSAPQPEPGFIVVKAYRRRVRENRAS